MATIINDKKLELAGFYWRELDGVHALVCAPLESEGFTNGFSTRVGGTSPMPEHALNLAGFNEDSAENILENRRRFLKLFGGDRTQWTLAGCWQVHGADVRQIENLADAKPAEDARGDTVYCDALVSNVAGVMVGVKTADCVPILIGDPKTGAFAAVHAGWRGTFAGIVFHAIERLMKEYNSEANNLRVAIGPAAAACCYEVGSEIIDGFRERFPYADDLFTPTREAHARLDLLKANHYQLTSAGVDPDRIHTALLCTMDNTDLFFSYRREKNVLGKVGRLMSVIGRKQ
ncbi:MAG: peptidoglycan editing factor PgeF [Acidobacteriota bacterium]|nr:peptidoglycan editing factor PgeF [Acidobacteriota bacterium]